MQVVVYGKQIKDQDIPYVQALFDALQENGINVYVFSEFLPLILGKVSFKKDVGLFEGFLDFAVKKLDYFITLGGDGTILSAVTHVRNSGVPIMGINLGRLGFLASIEKKRIREAIELMIQGRFSIDERSLLHLESDPPLFGELPFALNDFTILKRDTSSMITIHTYVNGAYLSSYWADGIIVATPTGSTGYSLSCGGPIVFPDSGNFVLTPVAPHNLSVRPIVLSDNAVISFDVEGRTENFLCTLDSRFESITSQHQIAIRKNNFLVKLLQLPDESFLKTIRNKLAWGADTRN